MTASMFVFSVASTTTSAGLSVGEADGALSDN
jgi:hypothetical protein